MHVLVAVSIALASLTHALPTISSFNVAGAAVDQLVMKAQDVGHDAIAAISADQPHTMTRWDWSDCGEPTDVIQIKDVRISPDPPKPGKNLTVYASGTVNSLIDQGAYADVTVKLGLIKLLTKRFDVCEELDNANSTLQCPIQPNDYSIEQTVALPAEIPRGKLQSCFCRDSEVRADHFSILMLSTAKFQVSARVFTQDEKPAACIDLWINFLLPDPLQQIK
ncbi:hypothetical protein OIO90_001608 [Microbotryomycetes sp. JL221]|nr:hypothetical protein OIO90_001608 [Microbotryomycetes sp. JL221]